MAKVQAAVKRRPLGLQVLLVDIHILVFAQPSYNVAVAKGGSHVDATSTVLVRYLVGVATNAGQSLHKIDVS